MLELYISSKSRIVDLQELKIELEKQLVDSSDIAGFEIRQSKLIFRDLDPTILVAIVSSLGTGFGALITGILQVIKEKKLRMITIQTKGGSKIEVPADISSEELNDLIKKVKELDSEDLKIVLP